MRLLWRTLRLILVILTILTSNIFVINFLPFPLNHINITFSLLLLLVTTGYDKKIIWLVLIVSYLSELFSGAPFGIGVAVTIISLLAINWFQLNILTNRSWYMIFLSLLFGITLHRITFVLFLIISNYFSHRSTLPYKEIMADAGWEILLSSVVIFILYYISSKFLKRLNPTNTMSANRRGTNEVIYG